MTTLLLIIHVLVCFFLIFIVLLQRGRGAEIGAAFGGSSQTLFGSRGSATFLNKLTAVTAVIFMVTSLSLAILTTKKGGSVVEKAPAVEKTIPQSEGLIPSKTEQQAPAQQ